MLLLQLAICTRLREVEIAVQGCVGTEMKKTIHLSVVIGVALAEMKAAQGQTEDAHAQIADLHPRTARFGISALGN